MDIFAFGVTAYELLTGSKPFPGETPEDVLRQQLDMHFLAPPRDLTADPTPRMRPGASPVIAGENCGSAGSRWVPPPWPVPLRTSRGSST